MISNVFMTLAFILFPALVIWLASKIKILQKIGLVLICYLSGMLVGNLGILPESFVGSQTMMTEVSAAIALPLLLFSLT